MLFYVFECFSPKEIFLCRRGRTGFVHCCTKPVLLLFVEPRDEMFSLDRVGPRNPTSAADFHFVELELSAAGRLAGVAGVTTQDGFDLLHPSDQRFLLGMQKQQIGANGLRSELPVNLGEGGKAPFGSQERGEGIQVPRILFVLHVPSYSTNVKFVQE